MNVTQPPVMSDSERRSRIRRNVLLLVGVALAFYVGFIYLVVTRSP